LSLFPSFVLSLSMLSVDSFSPEEEEEEKEEEEFSSSFSSMTLVIDVLSSLPYANLKFTLKSMIIEPCFMLKMCTSSNGTLAKSAMDSLKSFSTSRVKWEML